MWNKCDQIPEGQEETPRPAFLVIPMELRDMVYWYLYDAYNQSPPLIDSEARKERDSRQNRIKIKHGKRTYTEADVSYPMKPPSYPLLPILQVNQQMRKEFTDFLARARRVGRGLRYELELSFPRPGREFRTFSHSSDYAVKVNWLCLPLPPEKPWNVIQELVITYRVLDYSRNHQLPHYLPGSPSWTNKQLFTLFNYFVCHGPQWFYNSEINKYDPDIPLNERTIWPGGRCQPFIETMIVDFRFDYTAKEEFWLCQSLEVHDDSNAPGHYERERNKTLYSHTELKYARSVGYVISEFETRGYLQHRVGKVSVLANGENVYPDRSIDKRPPDRDFLETYTFEVSTPRDMEAWKPNDKYEKYDFNWKVNRRFIRARCLQSLQAHNLKGQISTVKAEPEVNGCDAKE